MAAGEIDELTEKAGRSSGVTADVENVTGIIGIDGALLRGLGDDKAREHYTKMARRDLALDLIKRIQEKNLFTIEEQTDPDGTLHCRITIQVFKGVIPQRSVGPSHEAMAAAYDQRRALYGVQIGVRQTLPSYNPEDIWGGYTLPPWHGL